MGGVLLVSAAPEATWLPPGWIFDDALDRLAAAVPAEREQLELAIESSGAYPVDLRAHAPERFAPLAAAARRPTGGSSSRSTGHGRRQAPRSRSCASTSPEHCGRAAACSRSGCWTATGT